MRGLVILSVVLTALGAAALVTTLRLKRDVARLQSEVTAAEELERALDRQLARERTERLEAGAALRRERTARGESARWPVFELGAGPARPGARPTEVAIDRLTALVVLELIAPVSLSADSYRAGLRSAPGDEFWMQSRLELERGEAARGRPARRVIRLEIPASALKAGDYELSLQGVPAASGPPIYYYFSVSAR